MDYQNQSKFKEVFQIIATISIGILNSMQHYIWVAIPALFLIVLSVSSLITYNKKAKKDSVRKVLKQLCQQFPAEVRCTLLVPKSSLLRNSDKRLVQFARYATNSKKVANSFTIAQGVAGLCYRIPFNDDRLEYRLEKIDNPNSFIDIMVKKWGFLPEQAEKFIQRRSYLCIPLCKGDEVLGILCLDSASIDTFEDLGNNYLLIEFVRVILEDILKN